MKKTLTYDRWRSGLESEPETGSVLIFLHYVSTRINRTHLSRDKRMNNIRRPTIRTAGAPRPRLLMDGQADREPSVPQRPGGEV